jgi:uncharacterized membrane protein
MFFNINLVEFKIIDFLDGETCILFYFILFCKFGLETGFVHSVSATHGLCVLRRCPIISS